MTIPQPTATAQKITLRRLRDADRAAVLRLSQLDSAKPLEGELLGLEVDRRLVAAVSLTTGRSIADPFVPSLEARMLLELRADQLRGRDRRSRLRWSRARPRSRAALPSSPPGGGGRLLDLLRASLS